MFAPAKFMGRYPGASYEKYAHVIDFYKSARILSLSHLRGPIHLVHTPVAPANVSSVRVVELDSKSETISDVLGSLPSSRSASIPRGSRRACRNLSTTMEIHSVHARTLACLALFCLTAFGQSLARRVDARSTRLGAGGSTATDGAAPQTCSNTTDLELSGANQSFTIKCPDGSAGSKLLLTPVESTTASAGRAPAHKLNDVYRVTPAGGTRTGKKCGADQTALLDNIAPGSTLKAVSTDGEASSRQVAQDSEQAEEDVSTAVNATVFTLELGDGQEDDREFCYTCVANTTASAEGRQATCSIFVTVPKKENSGTTDPSPDSGSVSASLFGWFALSVIGCMLGSILHL